MDLGDYDSGQYDNYTYNDDNETTISKASSLPITGCFDSIICIALIIINVVIFILGFCGNAVVIWIAGFKMNKSVNTTWYLSLAISDFIFCACLPFGIANLAMGEWIFGLVMCKLTSFVMFLNMFSSIFLLVVISVDRCVSVAFPVWAQNQRTVRKASAVVVLAWLMSITLSMPSMVFRDVSDHRGKNKMTKSTKPFKVMSALIATFFICWLPYHFFILLELNPHQFDVESLTIGLQVGTTIATANSFLNPFLYVFMGNDFKQKFKSSLLNKMENAMGEDGRTLSRYLSRSSSYDARASTHI
ncbi:chemerin-like receptor 1 isoform X2 [Gadus chalcogrammus]|uniref:chemerin-like receptor 1 isoform X2 n=1 Tax=Gadus chalcogrammus TaxID=1042646 RepID=UPI0024C3EF03|nr:chemerin-like receptor 1 isoform X2 [Gadus chalcogrammus]